MCARNVHKSRYLGPNRSPQESHRSPDLRCQGSCHKHRRHYPMSPPGADITVMSLTASSALCLRVPALLTAAQNSFGFMSVLNIYTEEVVLCQKF